LRFRVRLRLKAVMHPEREAVEGWWGIAKFRSITHDQQSSSFYEEKNIGQSRNIVLT
jgi:hypothetical protein